MSSTTVSAVGIGTSPMLLGVRRLKDSARRRMGLDAGRFPPARRRRLDDSWIPEGLAPFGIDRVSRSGMISVAHVPADGSCDGFRRMVQKYAAVVDDSSSGLSPEERARRLVRAAACGTPVVAEPDLASSLPADIASVVLLLTSPSLDDSERAMAVAHRQWSAVFDHLSPVTCDVSITIATNRPTHLDLWLTQIANQSYRNLQVVAVFHGDGFTSADRETVQRVMRERGFDVVLVDASSELSLGATLDLARTRADGDVILKWDDDDLYSSNHVVDLLRARHYSGAPLVGKACDFVYLGSRDVTVRRHQADRESFSPTLSGNTLMIDRDALDAVDGWTATSLGEDVSLIQRVRRAGGRTYRTAGFGMIAVRQADPSRHTWQLDESSLEQGAVRSWPGLALDVAMVDVPSEVSDAVRRLAAGGR